MSEFREILERSGIEVRQGKIVLPTTCERVKIDVGLSSNAPQSSVWLERDPGLIVFGFEPVSANIRHIMDGSSHHPQRINPELVGKRFFPIPIALGSESEMSLRKMHVTSEDSGCSSLLVPVRFEVGYLETAEVWPLKTFFELFPFHEIPLIDHLKTDCQGTDLDVLKGAGQWLSNVLVITAECESDHYLGATNSRRIMGKYLDRQGFTRLVPARDRTLKRILREVSQDSRFLKGLINQNVKELAMRSTIEDPTYIRVKDFMALERTDLFLYQMG